MIAKKSIKADLERKRFAFFQIGLLVAGSLCLAAFEYTTANYQQKMAVVQFEEPTLGIEDAPEEVVVEEEIKLPQPNVQVLTLDVDSLNAVDVDPVKTIFNPNGNNVAVDPDTKFNPFAGLNMGIEEEKEPVFEDVTQDPQFVGGLAAMYTWIGKNVVYPELPREMGLSGTAYVSFVVEKDGSISQVKTLNPSGDIHEDFLTEGKRVVRKMPNWIPGENMGKKVRVRYTLPIKFEQY